MALAVLLLPLRGQASESEDEPMMSPMEAASEPVVVDHSEPGAPIEEEPAEEAPGPQRIRILGKDIEPGTAQALDWQVASTATELDSPNRILVVNGVRPGPTLCLTAAVHGDEINGIEIVRRVLHSVDPENLNGALIGVPIVNRVGFLRSSRYMSDRRDLNRHFPGNPSGSAASRLAFALFHDVVAHCNYLIDLHTGSFHRINIPQLRADLSREQVRAFTKGFGGITVLNHEGAPGTLRRAAVDAGIPAVTLEAGGPLHLDKAVVDYGTKAIENVMHSLEMRELMRFWLTPKPTYYQSTWIRSESSGILISTVELGDKVSKRDVLGEVIDPISNKMHQIRAPFDGQILGMALDQFVSPGYAVYRIGIESTEEAMAKSKPPKTGPATPPIDVDDPDEESPASTEVEE
ncbi:MAG: M14 family metallopeptidase [Ketobacteraceae bacterium]|nr:M14 family metallopeptidase [Ketobacteraceae bacterium]